MWRVVMDRLVSFLLQGEPLELMLSEKERQLLHALQAICTWSLAALGRMVGYER